MNKLAQKGRKIAIRQLKITLIIIVLSTIVTFFMFGFSHAQSAALGGIVALIPNMLFAYKAFQYAGASAARKVVDAFNSGVKLKLVLSAVLFALCFKFIENLQLPAFFITYFLAMFAPFVQAVANGFTINQQ